MYRISVLDGNRDHWQAVQKKNKDIHHSDREGARSLEESLTVKVTATKLESPEKIKFKTIIHAVSYNNTCKEKKSVSTLKHLLFRLGLNYLNLLFSFLLFM